ncbi:GNAT family N-acetyltransferase [Paenibacillus sp. N1-5-1-14]|uniref:GNAT family N-acetyltransferase n=1 Tax=Paenibacillus radicibacter TaxID=2972488 RepID=UPI0021597164|nr:GNAT family protein [Paenibacillus radicibacter]MCR8641188.1 GNAT family N-acetyltransferase [Paenibacillus radicibacter]
MIHIRAVQPEEFEAFWALRLEGLQTNPEAFGSTYEESVKLSAAEAKGRLRADTSNFVIGAHTVDGSLVGMFGFKRESGIKSEHKGFIWGVYLKPRFRGQGIAKQLLDEVICKARAIEGLRQINLSVLASNESAKYLYMNAGFETYGFERCALMKDGQCYDEELMALIL